jgi:hypothetical protein
LTQKLALHKSTDVDAEDGAFFFLVVQCALMLVVGGKAASYTLGVQMAEAHLRNGLALGVLDLRLALLLALPGMCLLYWYTIAAAD